MKKIELPSAIFLLGFMIISCKGNVSISENIPDLNVCLRMEVQMRDSIYNLYPVPRTTMYFHTYILHTDGHIENEEFSQTTTCSNGWGVKELELILDGENQKVILGVSKSNATINNYLYVEITYQEFLNQADDNNNVRFTKTFGIH